MSDRKGLRIKKGEKFSSKISGRNIIAASFEGKLYDLDTTAPSDGIFFPVNVDSQEGLTILRHSAAHLLAHAVTTLYPSALPNAGPPTDDGFYYDIHMDSISSDDLHKIEEKMHELAEKSISIRREEFSRDDLLKMFQGNRYKTDKILENVPPGGSSSVYKQGDFVDFCTGPHVPDTSYLKNVKLLSISSTTYHGLKDEDKMVRIYGTAFPDEKSLRNYLKMREEAMKRDHRIIGQEMDLFVFNSERAPGFPLYTPDGTVVRNELISFMRAKNSEYGWEEVSTPHLFRDSMWKQSGHYAKYRDSMYLFQMEDGTGYAIKPMNCPGHITIFQREMHSFRDLPVKYCEPGTVYRYEKSGEVGGLTRPRMFTIDDGHAFLSQDQLVGEIRKMLRMIRETFDTIFGNADLSFDLSVMDTTALDNYLITYSCNSCGHKIEFRKSSADNSFQCPNCGSSDLKPDLSTWDSATNALREALEEEGINFRTLEGEAAFYGPKIDVHLKDALGRSWQMSTIQVDFNFPLNFELLYITSGGEKKHVVMLHRAIYGSYERIMAILLENYAGNLPTWLTPLQVYITSVSDRYNDYAMKVRDMIQKAGVRVTLDLSKETISKKIKLIRPRRPSYIVIIGEKEETEGTVSVRNRKGAQKTLGTKAFTEMIMEEIRERKNTQADF